MTDTSDRKLPLPKGWSKEKLGNLLEATLDFRGQTPKKLGMEWGGDIPALSARNVEMGRINFTKATNYGSEPLYTKWMTRGKVERGDIAITTEAPLGNVAQISDCKKYILSQRVILLKVDKKRISSEFLKYQLMSDDFQRLLVKNSTGTTAKGIKQSRLVRLPILFPPLHIQQKIADTLANIDNLLNQTQAVIDQTKVIKRSLTQQFLSRGIPGRHHDFVEWPGLGEYPISWDVVPLSVCLSHMPESGVSPKPTNKETGYHVLALSALSHDGYMDGKWKPVEQIHYASSKILRDGDFLISRSNTHNLVGLVGIYLARPNMQVMFPDLMMRLRVNTTLINPDYLFFYLSSPLGRRILGNLAAGTSGSMKKLNKTNLLKIKVLLPKLDEQQEIVGALTSINERIRAEQAKKIQLEIFKKGLMQQLLTGQLPVKV